MHTGNAPSQGKPSKAERYKAKANEAFKAGDFDGAITGYSGAIQADPRNPVYFSNRAMAYLKVQPAILVETALHLLAGVMLALMG